MSYQLPENENKAEYVRKNFNQIAAKYDLFNDLNSFFLHRLWKNQIAKIVETEGKSKNIKPVCMDLCCGTGDISLRLLKLNTTQKVYSVDFSEEMLGIARERLRSFADSKSDIVIGDATKLHQFRNESLDVVTIGFGLRNVSDIQKTLDEIKRVLKPGGIFLNLDVGKVKIPIIKQMAEFYFFHIVPLMGYLIWGGKNEMFDYLPASSVTYPDQQTLKAILEKTGFKNVSFQNYVFGNAVLHFARK